MKNLIEEMAVFVDIVDMFTKKVNEMEATFKATEELHIRDANRIASLELTVMRLNERLLDTERNVIIQADGEVFSVKERMDALAFMLDDHDSKIDDLECVVEDKVDRDEVEDMIERNDIDDLIIDAVRNEIDAIDFKVTVER